MLGTVTLSIGQVFHLRRVTDRIVYAGMLSEDTYSIVQIKDALVNNPVAWNLFFSKKQRNITIDTVKINVENVSPEEITISVE